MEKPHERDIPERLYFAYGSNINQIARKLNAGLGTKANVQEVKYLLRLVCERMEEVADR